MRITIFLKAISLLAVSSTAFAAAAPPAKYHMKEYINKANAYRFRYPSYATLSDQSPNFYLVNSKCWSLSAQCNVSKNNPLQKVLQEVTLVNIQNAKTNPQSLYIGIHIGVSQDPQDVKTCTNAPGVVINEQEKKTSAFVNQNNVAFTVIPFSDAGMSKSLKGQSYRIVHGNTCWSIDRFQTGVNSDMNVKSKKDLSKQEIDDLYGNTLDIINTFSFFDNDGRKMKAIA